MLSQKFSYKSRTSSLVTEIILGINVMVYLGLVNKLEWCQWQIIHHSHKTFSFLSPHACSFTLFLSYSWLRKVFYLEACYFNTTGFPSYRTLGNFLQICHNLISPPQKKRLLHMISSNFLPALCPYKSLMKGLYGITALWSHYYHWFVPANKQRSN